MTARLPKSLRTRVADERRRDGDASCRCSHAAVLHATDGECQSTACGCATFRADDGARWTPARFREGDSYDPSPDGIDRSAR